MVLGKCIRELNEAPCCARRAPPVLEGFNGAFPAPTLPAVGRSNYPGGAVEHGRLSQIIERRRTLHRTLGMHIKQAAISVGVRPMGHGQASGASLNILTVNIGLRLTPLGANLKAGNAPRPSKKAGFRAPGAVAAD